MTSLFKRVLLPLDGSPSCELTLKQLGPILKSHAGEAIVFQATDIGNYPEADLSSLKAEKLKEAEAYVADVQRKLAADGVKARGVARDGSAADLILGTAAKEGASLIAMSTHGRSGIARWALGSVTEKVLRAGDIPVLVLRSFKAGAKGEPVASDAGPLAFKNILVPIDGSDRAYEILPFVTELAGLFKSTVRVVTAIDSPLATASVGPNMEQAIARFKKAGLDARPVLKRGDAALEILQACQDTASDLIAISTHGRSGLSRWVLGSVTEKVLRSAAVPLLVARSKGVPS